MYSLPTSIKINNVDYPIRYKGDYRVVLDCFEAMQDYELDKAYRILSSLIIFYDNVDYDNVVQTFGDNLEEATLKMFEFFECEDNSGAHKPYKLLDWKQDSSMVVSAINNVAKKEIRSEPYIHWWTFMSYFMAIGDCSLANVISIRDKIMKGKKLEKYEQEFKRDNPQYFNWNSKTAEDLEKDKLVADLWNNE